jgi:sialidase-1
MKSTFLINSLIILTACLESCSVMPIRNSASISVDPVIGTNKRPDPAMEAVSINSAPTVQYMKGNLDYGMTIGIERTSRGRIWCCWVGGGDDSKAFFCLAWSDDDGETWTDTRAVLDPHDSNLPENRRTIVGNLWCDPDGCLWLFFDEAMTYYDGRGGTWYTRCNNPDDNAPKWSKPKYVGIGFCLNKPTVLSNGDWILAESLWKREVIDILLDKGRTKNIYHNAYHQYDSLRKANVFISEDKGEHWQLYPGVAVPGARHDENMLVELKDHSVMMTIRSQSGWIYKSVSKDGGRTWSCPEQYLPQVNSRHFIRKLSNGKLLLVKHGKIDELTKDRSHLMAFLSDDDGVTWRGGLELDERSGISYPDGFEAPDGYIYISYDRNRSKDGEILLARFNQSDIIDQAITSERGELKRLISKITK